jgi:HlyD family secretion protein
MPAPARTRRAAAIAAAVLGSALFFYLVYLGLTFDLRAADREPEAAYTPTRVVRGDLRETIVATGTTEPLARVVMQSEIPGIVARVHVDDGERVKQGQPLVELDRERIEHRVAELRAALQVRQAEAMRDLVGRAEADLDQMRRDHARIAKLHAQGVASESAIEDLRHKLRLAEIGVTDARAEKSAREAGVAEATEALRQAERDLEKSVIRSPIDGVVMNRQVEVGAAVADIQNGGTVIATLADDRKIHLLATVDENDVTRARVGQMADVKIDAFPGETFTGRLRKIASSATTQQNVATFQIEIELEPDERVRVGMSADARVIVREHHGVLLVPNTAIVRTPDGPRVRMADGAGRDEPALAPIREVYSDGFQTIVGEGVAEGVVVLVRSDAGKP